VRFSFRTPTQHTPWEDVAAFWREGDGIDLWEGGWLFDHLDPIAGDPVGPVLEGWTALSALSTTVRRLRLGILVTANTYRHPSMLAKAAASLDVISGGRLELGLGTGWGEAEHRAYGIPLPPWPERFDRLEETCEILHRLFTEETVDVDGPFHRLQGARALPKPVQRPRPPFTIGGTGERRTLRIAARWADHWNFPGGDPESLRHKLAVLHDHCAAVGRRPFEIEVSVKVRAGGDPGALAEAAARHREAGADHLIVSFSSPLDPSRLATLAEALDGL
jgi:F420-dependent oxidoreductase-like protein